MRTLMTTALLLLAASAHAGDRPPYSAQETLQRAQVGTYSPRLAVRKPHPGQKRRVAAVPADFERVRCAEDPAAPRTLLCEPRRAP